jgi:hypothetical protein
MQIEPINIVNEENYRRKTEVFLGLHARGEVLKNKSHYSRTTLFLDTLGICCIHFWTAFFENCAAIQIEPINIVNEEN